VTLIKKGEKIYSSPTAKKVKLTDGTEIYYQDDGTEFMGTSWDFLDVSSNDGSELVSEEVQERREYLKNLFSEEGYKISDNEWWHFRLV
jgi:D-alanyl-D-alanine dipeptidase